VASRALNCSRLAAQDVVYRLEEEQRHHNGEDRVLRKATKMSGGGGLYNVNKICVGRGLETAQVELPCDVCATTGETRDLGETQAIIFIFLGR
jgi:hypothetical protein